MYRYILDQTDGSNTSCPKIYITIFCLLFYAGLNFELLIIFLNINFFNERF